MARTIAEWEITNILSSTIVLSLVFHLVFFQIARYFLSFNKDGRRKVEMEYCSSRSLKLLHALVVTVVCVWTVSVNYGSNVLSRGSFNDPEAVCVRKVLYISLGYYLADCIIIYCYFRDFIEYEMWTIVHHFFTVAAVFLDLLYDGRNMVMLTVTKMIVLHIQVPLESIVWGMKLARISKTSWSYFFAFSGFLLVYYATHIFSIPMMWYFFVVMIRNDSSIDVQYVLPFGIKLWIALTMFTLDCLSCYWGYRFTRKYLKSVSLITTTENLSTLLFSHKRLD